LHCNMPTGITSWINIPAIAVEYSSER
jgi:hypothetical protein